MFGVINQGGQRFDLGNKLDFLKTNLHFALKHPELAEPLREFLRRELAAS
jgi:UTP--glucose-1-phosphate uridylyltransferase